MAATYGLHRVASHRNMKPMLPPDHRDIWMKLDDLKKQHLADSPSATSTSTSTSKKGSKSDSSSTQSSAASNVKRGEDKSYMYAEDPFLAERERKARIEKRKEDQSSDKHKKAVEMRKIMDSVNTALSTEKSSAVSSRQVSASNSGANTPKPKSDANQTESPDSSQPSNSQENSSANNTFKPRQKRPRFDKWMYMSKETRIQAEALIKKYHGFELIAEKLSNTNNNVKWDNSNERYQAIVNALLQMGFPLYHAEEALEYCTSLTDSIEWLLIHVPEDDLPSIFSATPEKMDSRSTTTVISTDLKFEYAVRDIRAQGGYSEDLIRDQMKSAKGNKRNAIVSLTQSLVSSLDNISTTNNSDEAAAAHEDARTIWTEEMESLESIYNTDELINNKTQLSCTFKFEIPVKFDSPNTARDSTTSSAKSAKKKNVNYNINLTIWMPDHYPNSIPGITIEATPVGKNENAQKIFALKKYNLLDLIKRSGSYVQEALLGEFMVLSIVEWFKDNFADVITRPSKLVKLASGITGVEESEESSNSRKIKPNKGKSNSRKVSSLPVGNSLDAKKLMEERKTKLENSSNLKAMMESRKSLPAWKKQDEIINLLNSNQVVLITGETGSGKSTQVGQFVLDSLINSGKGNTLNIICSQPRRISAMGLAQRVADERDTPVGEEVGYVIRGESKSSKQTLLRFVTTGVLLRMIQSSSNSNGDSSAKELPLQSVSHVIVDEVHERSLDSDFLLILLKRMISVRKDIKIILMSATVDPALFISYFGGKSKVGYTHIEGRTFPVQDYYLDKVIELTGYTPPGANSLNQRKGSGKGSNNDYDYGDDDFYDETSKNSSSAREIGIGQKILAIAKQGIPYELISVLVSFIDRQLGEKDGAILIFMPGTAEIDRCLNTIKSSPNGYRYHALPLHASLAPVEQRKVFPLPPKGTRKVVVSTNVAETSITIPDIVAVIDTGRVKETKYDISSNVTRLQDGWTSKAAATQRRGRAGRVRQGDCYKLFAKSVEERDMPDRPLPEMLRVPLEQLYLSVKAMGIKATTKFLNEALDPPHIEAIDRARYTLRQLGALEEDHNANFASTPDGSEESLTPLGVHMSMIPADLRCAKLLVLSAMFGCMDTGLTIASILSLRSPFVSIKDKREEIRIAITKFSGPNSTRKQGGVGDLLTQAKAYYEWEKQRHDSSIRVSEIRHWCKDNYLSYQTLQDIQSAKRQFISSLQEIGFIPAGSLQKVPLHYTVNDDLETLQRTGLVRAVIGASMGPTHVATVVLPEKVYKSVGGAGAIEMEIADSKGIRYYGPNTRNDDFITSSKSTETSNTQNSSNNSVSSNTGNTSSSSPYLSLVERLFVHPASSLFETTKFLDDTLAIDGYSTGYSDGAFMSFSRKMQTSNLFIDGLTPLSTYGLVFFADNLKVDTLGNGIVVSTGNKSISNSSTSSSSGEGNNNNNNNNSKGDDGGNSIEISGDWLGLRCWPRIGILVKLLRHLFNNLVSQKLRDPNLDLSQNEVMLFIQKIIETNGSIR